MTKKQFKVALLRGQGRCILAVQENPKKYYDLVLWACSHEVAFDAQCEGTRAWFVYQLIDCYPKKRAFLEAIINSFEEIKGTDIWKMLYLSELLSFCAEDGSKRAQRALWDKYERIYSAIVPENCEIFEMLCVVLAEERKAVLKIAEDIGFIYRGKKIEEDIVFDWLYSKMECYLPFLEKQAEKSINIAEYLKREQMRKAEWEQRSAGNSEKMNRTGIALSIWLRRSASQETVLQYAAAYSEEENPKMRAEALQAFSRCPYPKDPTPIIIDAKSTCEELKNAAWEALENIRHPLVREFAFENLQSNPERALPLLIKNYQDQDADLLIERVKALPIEHSDTTTWHGIQSDILGMQHEGQKEPAALLEYIYETTYCSCCREFALRRMGKRRMLKKEMLQECLFDCNSEIRNYAKRRLKNTSDISL